MLKERKGKTLPHQKEKEVNYWSRQKGSEAYKEVSTSKCPYPRMKEARNQLGMNRSEGGFTHFLIMAMAAGTNVSLARAAQKMDSCIF